MILNMLFHSFYVKSTQNGHLFYFGIFNDTVGKGAQLYVYYYICGACLVTEIGRPKILHSFFIFIPFLSLLECLIAKQQQRQFIRHNVLPTLELNV